MTKWSVGITVSVLAVVIALVAAPIGAAKRGDDIRVAGACTSASASKLKLSGEDRGIEVEFEVDQNRNGRRWMVVLRKNGARVARLARVTRAPSGSFKARIVVSNAAGTDTITARATSPSGEVCTARASF